MLELKLQGTAPGGPLDDLAPLVQLASAREVIGLGEPTHGTREAFELKHRLIRALAEAGELRTVAFECGLIPGRLVDEYVRLGKGTARAALAAQGYGCWQNREVLALIEWLRSFNHTRPAEEQVRFVGIDVQDVEMGLAELRAALTRVGGSSNAARACAEAADFVSELMAGRMPRGAPAAAAAVPVLLAAARALDGAAEQGACRNVARHVDAYLSPAHQDGLTLRDEYMAATLLEAVAERPGLAVVWAHNEHVALNPDFDGARAMGHHLREVLAEGYLALGMLFGTGSFLARSWEERRVTSFSVEQPVSSYTESRLLGNGLGIVSPARVARPGLAQQRRFIGNLYDEAVYAERPEAFRVERPITDFDLVAWLPETTAATYLG